MLINILLGIAVALTTLVAIILALKVLFPENLEVVSLLHLFIIQFIGVAVFIIILVLSPERLLIL